uniref:Unconventional myosin-XV n=1 Tax=Strigamia maritima TaxID=126957 RepID=T1JBR9_STRMM
MEEFQKGDLIWFDPGFGYALPGEVVEYHRAGQVITVQAIIGGKSQVFTMNNVASVKRRQELASSGEDDMIHLNDLNEASLLWNLRLRYDKQLIYTYTGSILVAVNPYKMFDIYGLDVVKKYEGQILGTLPPHLFAIGSSAYATMSKDRESQVVVISGESGAGKTESTKLIMQYLAAVNKSSSNLITEQILEASPLLEAFGNAKTVRNDNSSRFGKYLEVHFKNGVITGANTTEYLLEKSRIVTQAPEERNYHVFYEILAGLNDEEKEKYGLTSADKYFYLNQGGSCEISCKDDGEDFQALLSAVQVLGFSLDEQETIFRILSSVLHLGNIYFHRKPLKHGQEGVEIGSNAEIKWTSHLLQLSPDGIVQALTTKTTEARNEKLMTPLNLDQALDARDAISKALYSRLFSWLVQRINSIVCKGSKKTSIAILDIFGFEDFQENSFEQLCINYANETLQFYFNKHIFKLEQQEYAKEKIEWQTIAFQDNQPVINLISKKPVGILHLLDDESNFPKATDMSFLEKCHYNHALNELYSRPRMSSMEFGITHYAGQVWYSVEGFLDKNRDTLRSDVVELLISSKLQMISKMFMDLRNTGEATKTVNRNNGRFVTMKPRTPTVAARFNDSLLALVENMTRCNPWFVRCIKPNNEKAPMNFDMAIVLEQLRYTGMLETIKIRKMGYPVRMKFQQFCERYRCLVRDKIPKGVPTREICKVILDSDPHRRDHYQLGTTKVFLRETMEQMLEQKRYNLLNNAAIILQKCIRGRVARKKFLSMRKHTTKIQARIRGFLIRQKYQKIRRGIIRAQATYRMARQKERYKELKDEMKRQEVAEAKAREVAKIKAQKSEMEKSARVAATGINYLEIPAELAFIFSKLEGELNWQVSFSDRNIIKVVGQVPFVEDSYRLPSDIDYFPFSKFVNIYFKSHNLGARKEPIKVPFLAKLKDSDYHESLAIFKLILRFMSDHTLGGKRESALGNYIVQKGLANESLRDETLCQLANQTWKNESEVSIERGWLLMANCMSCFPPSKTLYKYLMKYVSDQAFNGYKATCQNKLLQSERVDSYLVRMYPPCSLEWKTNRKHCNMALEVAFVDDELMYGPVESWTVAEEFCSVLLKERGINECWGWSVSLSHANGSTELNGYDYVLDAVSEKEIPPAFPVCNSPFLNSRDPNADRQKPTSPIAATSDFTRSLEVDVNFQTFVEPPRKFGQMYRTHEMILEDSRSASQFGLKEKLSNALSPSSALNGRYFEGSARAPSLEHLGLSQSKLNERYRSVENLTEQQVVNQNFFIQTDLQRREQQTTKNGNKSWNEPSWGLSPSALNDRYFQPEDEKDVSNKTSANFDSNGVHLNGHNKDVDRNSSPNRNTNGSVDFPEFDFPDSNPEQEKYNRNSNNRFIKSSKKAQSSSSYSHSTKGYLEIREGPKSSALSDTSEAPSLASHVRQVRVPSHTSDLDQYLDDLFNPVLDGNLDELSDARSLAASIKGGNDKAREINSNMDTFIDDLFDVITVDCGLDDLSDVDKLSLRLKGGGEGVGGMDSQGATATATPFNMMLGNLQSPVPGLLSPQQVLAPGLTGANPLMGGLQMMSPVNATLPLYTLGGFNLPMWNPASGIMDPNQIALQQQLLQQHQQQAMQINAQMQQRAFLASAVQQNLQMQQQLMQQNQALQQLLQQSETQESPGHMKAATTSQTVNHGHNKHWSESGQMHILSPPPPLPPKSSSDSPPLRYGQVTSPPFNKSPLGKSPQSTKSAYGEVLSELRSRKSSSDTNHMKFIPTGNIPPPPPLPPELPESNRPFVNVYGRAKTVRIGKWRWPPLTDGNDSGSYFEFKLRQHQRRSDDGGRLSSSSDDIGDYSKEKKMSSVDDFSSTDGQRSHDNSFESDQKQAAGSIGKLKISSEMKAKLEAVTLNHSVRSTSTSADARRVYAAVNKLKAQARDDGGKHIGIRKLEENRKLALQQQLGGLYGSNDFDDDRSMEMGKEIRVSVFRNRSPQPPPPPVAPPTFNMPPIPPPLIGGGNGYYDGGDTSIAELKSPPAPISPSTRGYNQHRIENRNENFSRSERIFQMENHRSETRDRSKNFVQSEVDSFHVQTSKTKHHPTNKSLYNTYTRMPWTLRIRKEVFTPSEELTNPLAFHLVFCQVVQDVFSNSCIRFNREERQKLRQLVDGYGITPNNLHSTHHKTAIKKNIVDLARDAAVYFARLFPVSGGRALPQVEMLGVSHSGVRLVRRHRDVPIDWLEVLDELTFEDIAEVSNPRGSTLQLLLQNGQRIVLYTHRALQIRNLIDQFALEADSGAHEYVRAVADYITRESTLLSFRKGDILRIVNNKNQYLDKGWLYGILDDRAGIFPCEYVLPLGRNEAVTSVKKDVKIKKIVTTERQTTTSTTLHSETITDSPPAVEKESVEMRENRETNWIDRRMHDDFPDDKSDTSFVAPQNDGKHSLLQFALLNFRQSLDKYEMLRTADGSIRGSLKMIESLKTKKKGKKGKDSDWTWKEQVEMVKYTKSPIQASLLKLDSSELNKLALECFISIMQYMGDYPQSKNKTEVECVYGILMNCHHHPHLRDEVYCQIMKQTTNNKSPKTDSCQKGWRLFSIIAAYFDCSDLLKPYLFKYLETAAYDKRRAYHGTAMVCLQNLRKTFKYGGRKNVPSIEEITAITAGRNSKRQIYRLPGGTERVVADIIEEICSHLNIRSQQEMEEFSLYCIVEGDTFTMPLAREEYILDVTTELHKNQQVFYLIFCRSVWYCPLRLDSELYIEVVFNQIAPDYLEGMLLVTPGETIPTDIVYDISKVAALLHRAAKMVTVPNIKEIKYLLPKPALNVRDIKPPQWVNMVQSSWRDVEMYEPSEAKALLLEILQKWPLFGSGFFAVKKLVDNREKSDFVMALNRNGVHFLDVNTHETIYHYPFSEVISTRKVKAEDGTLFLDMKVGNLMVQKISRIQTEQAHQISRLIKQYIMIEQRNRGITQELFILYCNIFLVFGNDNYYELNVSVPLTHQNNVHTILSIGGED